jgi:hypothetical protein
MALMTERERHLGLKGSGENYGLLIPIRLGGGPTFPELVRQVQRHDFEEFADPDLPRGSVRASKANDSLKKPLAERHSTDSRLCQGHKSKLAHMYYIFLQKSYVVSD